MTLLGSGAILTEAAKVAQLRAELGQLAAQRDAGYDDRGVPTLLQAPLALTDLQLGPFSR